MADLWIMPLSSQVEANGFGVYYAVFDGLQWMVVDQRPLQRPRSLRRRAQRQRWLRGWRSLAPCATAGARQAATILPFGDVEDARFPIWHAARPRPLPCLGRG